MPFIATKISNYGVANHIVARMNVQTHELLQWAGIPQNSKDDIFDVYDGMKNRLLKCHEAYNRLHAPLKENLDKKHFSEDGTLKSLPFLIGLQEEAETILYEQKNFLRDLLRVVNIFFGTTFHEASAFCANKKKDDKSIVKWAQDKFGANNPFSIMLESEQSWIEEVIRKRNAVEHPRGNSGTLHIKNFWQVPDGRFALPVWHRDDMKPTGIFPDLEVTLDNLLTLAEDVLVSCIVHKNMHGDAIAFAEIPEQERAPGCPQRIRVVPGKAMLKQV
ncbi:hypothetical protein [Humidesulfovibrio sp.]